MRLAYVTRVVDEDAAVLATQVRWIRSLASKSRVESLVVLAGRVGRVTLPDHVQLREFGTGRGRLARFVAEAIKVRRSVDAFFVAQGGPFPALLLPLKAGNGPRIYQWKAHAVVSPRMRFYARYCDDLVFTSAPSSFPFEVPGRRVVGQGIDCNQFLLREDVEQDRDLVFVGRVSPIKGLEQAISILAAMRNASGAEYRFDIIGPGSDDYRESLRAHAERLGVGRQIHFTGPVPHSELPLLLPRYRVSVNMSAGALDKTILESMACGVPVVTSNQPTIESIPDDLMRDLRVDGLSDAEAAGKMEAVLRLDPTERRELGAKLRRVVVDHHSVERLFDKILDEIERYEGARPRKLER